MFMNIQKCSYLIGGQHKPEGSEGILRHMSMLNHHGNMLKDRKYHIFFHLW